MRSSITTVSTQALYNLAMDLSEGFKRRFAFVGNGLFIHPPFAGRSLWVEWREVSIGLGIEQDETGTVHLFAGRLQGTLSTEGTR
ncbi:hypothetical protein [Rhizobium sp. AG855]|uniref:hypothetical protein n=1 Tax=Rhizobium sp. AG855 TaxID=2183898 RepID=UPI000FF66CB2|nr:hypothetical protein [Rhizobium sp. AG855]RKE86252.1 hypothetical protein DFO46_3061 [Rhizobium sp. AG855]